ncbi:SusC/RagA family TonB-linked outer membrane protein [Pedobacter sp. MW01-1-1]|uniref:SusC/RagA family TonB-linked outer membrane protein n=1 Tax=Pedobacter sp. MW01-1-1 TaxID=3383027 RepID=UPI003FF05B4E
MYKIVCKLFVLLTLIPALSFAQTVIKGVVSDEGGVLPGASIVEKGLTNNGTTTGGDGSFQLALKGTSKTIIVKSIGYLTREVNVAGKATISIKLETDSKGLDEVMVVGYGQQKKITNTGSISSISATEIKQNPSASIQNTLAGRLPGFTAQQRSGQPGADGAAFFIRGVGTYGGGTQPLIIVDDVEYDYSKVSQLDPNEVETVSILKDASTTAIYGIKGANGVLIITTKRGVAGKPRINLKSETGYQMDVNTPEFLDSYTALSLRNEGIRNTSADRGTDPTIEPNYLSDAELNIYRDGSDPYGHPNIDWWKTIFKPGALITRQNLDFQGGTESVKYFVSAGYLWQNGNIRDYSSDNGVNSNYYYKRYNFRSNLDIQATKTLSIRLDLSGRFGETNSPYNSNQGNAYYANGNGIVGEIYSGNYLPPWAYPVTNPNGSYPYNPDLNISATSIIGRLAESGFTRKFDNDLNIVSSANQKLDFITKGLQAKVLLSYASAQNNNLSIYRTALPYYYYDPTAVNPYLPLNANQYRTPPFSQSYSNSSIFRTVNLQSSLNYNRDFGSHHVYGLVLYNDNRLINSGTVGDDNQGPGIPTVVTGTTFRTGYDYKNRYLIEFNAAYNGTDRFTGEKTRGWFPAGSIGWNISEEKFFSDNIKFVDLLKIRASYGLVGSDDIGGAKRYVQFYETSSGASGANPNTSAGYNFGTSPTPYIGITEGDLGNENVTWEKSKKLDIGIDLNMFKGKIKIVADYFNNDTYDILTTRKSVPYTLGVGLPPVNLGRVNNRGYDGEIGYNDRFGALTFGARFTFSYAKNKILYQDEAQPAYPWLAATGNPIGQYFGWTYIGFYSAEDIVDPTVAKPTTAVGPGDLKYADLNGDGIIDTSDQGAIGRPNLPNTTYGANFNFGYKNFYLNLFFQGSSGYSTRFHSETITPGTSNYQPIHLTRWTPETAATATFPRLGGTAITNYPNATANFSDFWTRDNYYIRLKTAEISYQFTSALAKKLHVQGIRVYANGNNLLTWTNVTDLYQVDPENGNSTTTVISVYPTQRIYNFGLQVSF